MNKARYPLKLSKYASHSVLKNWIFEIIQVRNEKISVLDIGCSKGEFAHLIDNLGVSYVGVEPHVPDASIAMSSGLTIRNCTAEVAIQELEGQFEVIVFGDVLEHLTDPMAVLSSSKRLLTQSGNVLVSVPNIAHFSTRLSLLFGIWNYKDRGILDNTHLRFFTRKTLKKLCIESGFQIVDIKYTPIPLEAVFENRKMLFFSFLDLVNYSFTAFAPRFFGYQIMVKLRKI